MRDRRRSGGQEFDRPHRPPQQPDEVPYREVDHDGVESDEPWYPDYWPVARGEMSQREWWGKPRDDAAERAEIEEREKRRRELGGFGFRIERA